MLDIEKTLNYIKNKAESYAVAKSQMEYLKEFRKSKKALLMVEAEQKGVKTGQEREAYAYSHKEYVELLEGLKAAMHESESLRLSIKAAELRVDVWRSQKASERFEYNAHGNK